MFEWIESSVRPPGIRRPGRRGIFRALGAVAQVVADDAARVLREWFPLTSSDAAVGLHGDAAGIPRFRPDSAQDYRLRVATAAQYLDEQGRRSFLVDYLDRVVPGRYRLTEYPRMGFRVGHSRLGSAPLGGGTRLFIRVRGITPEEQDAIYDALNRSLDPDIEIHVLAWIHPPPSPSSENTGAASGSHSNSAISPM